MKKIILSIILLMHTCSQKMSIPLSELAVLKLLSLPLKPQVLLRMKALLNMKLLQNCPCTLESLRNKHNAGILTYHVVAGKVKAKQAAKLDSAKTVNGAEIAIKASGKSLTINNAKVIKANIKTSNGIIHVIDTVLIPETKKVANNTNHILKQAIHKGVPMFNSGHHAQTAALYMKAGNEVLGQCSSSVCSSAANTIKTAMHKAKAEHCPTSQAWIMRHAFDQVLASAN